MKAAYTPRKIQDFWAARVAQACLILVAGLLLLPPFWSFFYLLFSGWFQTFELSLSNAFFLGFHIYPRSFFTAFLIAIILAFRSATWGSLSCRFTLCVTAIVAIVMDLALRLLSFLWDAQLSRAGFGQEAFIAWVAAFVLAGLFLWLLFYFSGLGHRYNIAERGRLYDALKAVVVILFFAPALYMVLTIIFSLKDQLVFMLARGPIKGEMNTAAIVIAALIAILFTARLRRKGMVSWLFIVLSIALPSALFFVNELIIALKTTVSDPSWRAAMIWVILKRSVCFIVILSLYCGVAFYGCGLSFSGKIYSKTVLVIKSSQQRWLDGAKIFIVLALVATVLWQGVLLLSRAFFIGWSPSFNFLNDLIFLLPFIAVFYALPVVGFMMLKTKISFWSLLLISFMAAFVLSFHPTAYPVVSLGFYYDHIGWPMLRFFPLTIISWYFLSHMALRSASISC